MSWHISKALMTAYGNSLSLREQAAEYLAANSSAGALFAPSSGSPTPQAYLCSDRMTAFSRLSRFGMTFAPLTDTLGAGVLTWFLAGFPVRTSAQPAREQESTEPALECGTIWPESFARHDHNSRSWRTPQCSLLEGLDEYSETWPRWGMMRGGVCWAQVTPERHTEESEFGLWPTPTVCGNYNRKGASATSGDGLATAVKMWPTPTAHNAKETNAKSEAERNTPTLAAQVGGTLNPTWVEWLMGWPLFWTSLDMNVKPYYDSWHETHQRAQTCAEKVQGGIVRNVWWDIDPSAAPQGRRPDQQRERQCNDTMPGVPRKNPLPDRKLGDGEREAGEVQDLQGGIQAQANAKIEAVRQAGMPEGKREEISRVAVGVTARVDRLKAIGNGQVPAVVKLAWETLKP